MFFKRRGIFPHTHWEEMLQMLKLESQSFSGQRWKLSQKPTAIQLQWWRAQGKTSVNHGKLRKMKFEIRLCKRGLLHVDRGSSTVSSVSILLSNQDYHLPLSRLGSDCLSFYLEKQKHFAFVLNWVLGNHCCVLVSE